MLTKSCHQPKPAPNEQKPRIGQGFSGISKNIENLINQLVQVRSMEHLSYIYICAYKTYLNQPKSITRRNK